VNHPAGILITLLVIVGCGAATPPEQRQGPRAAEQPASLDLGCKPVTATSAPGEPVRLQCELRNKGKRPANELRVVVVVNGVSRPGIAPKQLAPGETVTLELTGAELAQWSEAMDRPVSITVTGADIAATTLRLFIRVSGPAAICQGRTLTRRQYRKIVRELETMRRIGEARPSLLTPKERDMRYAKMAADLLVCVQ
jgi:hypothetical protein